MTRRVSNRVVKQTERARLNTKRPRTLSSSSSTKQSKPVEEPEDPVVAEQEAPETSKVEDTIRIEEGIDEMYGKPEMLPDSDDDEDDAEVAEPAEAPVQAIAKGVATRSREPIAGVQSILEDASSGSDDKGDAKDERDLSHLPTCEYNAFIDDETNEHYRPHIFPNRYAPARPPFIFSVGELARDRLEELRNKQSLSKRKHREVFCLPCMDFIMKNGECSREHDEFNDERLQNFWLEHFPHKEVLTKQMLIADLEEIVAKWE